MRRAAPSTDALLYTAEALIRQGDLARPAAACAFLLNWPGGATYRVQQTAHKLLDELAVCLPAQELAAAQEQGRQTQLDGIVALVKP